MGKKMSMGKKGQHGHFSCLVPHVRAAKRSKTNIMGTEWHAGQKR